MKDRPILFSAPMVRALLAGTKTQTRRVVKHSIRGPHTPRWTYDWHDSKGKWLAAHGGGFEFSKTNAAQLCPYGQRGERLWVREAWGFEKRTEDDPLLEPVATYRADEVEHLYQVNRWRPSIHMPRHLSRIKLEITGVRVERLQDISEVDAIAEGIEHEPCSAHWKNYDTSPGGWRYWESPIQSYRTLWNSINGPGSWDANPWVWALSFKRVPHVPD